jgi:hypothetical protein
MSLALLKFFPVGARLQETRKIIATANFIFNLSLHMNQKKPNKLIPKKKVSFTFLKAVFLIIFFIVASFSMASFFGLVDSLSSTVYSYVYQDVNGQVAGEFTVNMAANESASFTHPGLLNNLNELEFIKQKVANKEQPWYGAYREIPSYLNYIPQPTEILGTDPDQILRRDGEAAYGSALRWFIGGDVADAQKAVEIINAWSYKVKRKGYDSNSQLPNGYCWPQFVWAAEILRASYSGWNQVDQDKFSVLLRDIVYSAGASWPYKRVDNWAAWGIASRMAISIYLDDQTGFDKEVNNYREFINLYINPFPHNTINGITRETCRNGTTHFVMSGGDLWHTQMALAPITTVAEMAKHQNVDLYNYHDTRGISLLTALKFHAPFVGFKENPNRPGSSDAAWPCDIPLANIANTRPWNIWEMAYSAYRDPALGAVAAYYRPDSYDRIGWGTLTHYYLMGGGVDCSSCTGWVDVANSCGQNSCGATQISQTRNCSVAGCATSQCAPSASCGGPGCVGDIAEGACPENNKPKHCENGTLVNKCDICGCPADQTCNVTSGLCAPTAPPPPESEFLYDLNNDSNVNIADISIFLAHWNQTWSSVPCPKVDVACFANILSCWGAPTRGQKSYCYRAPSN